MSDLKRRNEARKEKIKNEIAKLKAFKAKCKQKLTVARLKTMKGFEHLTDEVAAQTIEQLEEYARIVLKQMNRLSVQFCKVQHTNTRQVNTVKK